MMERKRYIPTPEEIVAELPLSPALQKIKAERDAEMKAVLSGKSKKLLVLVGPCSAHDRDCVLEYATRLGKLNMQLKDKLVLVMRVYTNKPRTMGVGYKGMCLQPNPQGEVDIARGLRSSRSLHLSVLNACGLTTADELLYPEHTGYLEDALSYYAVGARSTENQAHREIASGLGIPVGFKNPMSGNLTALVGGIYASQTAQSFQYRSYQVQTTGNPFAHAVLRGGVDREGKDFSNYDHASLTVLKSLCNELGLQNPAVIVDCNHSNSGKNYARQPLIAEEVMKLRREDDALGRFVKGFMIESFLEEGNQASFEAFGKSITDPCLGFEKTKELLLSLAGQV